MASLVSGSNEKSMIKKTKVGENNELWDDVSLNMAENKHNLKEDMLPL